MEAEADYAGSCGLDLTLLISDGLAALATAVILVLDLAGVRITRRSRQAVKRGSRLMGAGICLECSIVFLTGLARYRHWSSHIYDGMHSYLMALMLVALGLIIAGITVLLRARRAEQEA